jgi:colanic acid/amylovoran biosynthesis glycosyltransferase
LIENASGNHAQPSGRSRVTGKIAYITTRFPSISHTFILREVNALRARGVEVHTVSIREVSGEHLLSEDNRRALESTYMIRPPRPRDVIGAHTRAFTRHPLAYLRALRYSLSIARPGWRGAIWQLFYFAEAIMLWRECVRVGAVHIHAHHGSPPADLALLAARFGELSSSGPSTWSMTMHGPTEFWNTRWFRLSEKIRRARGVVCISDFARSQLMALVDEQHWDKLEVVRCGLIPEQYDALTAQHATRAQILCVGRLVSEKGQAVLLDAHASLCRAGQEVDLVLVGSGPDRHALERLATELGAGEHVRFTGPVGQDEIKDHYAAASVFCSSSFSEGVPVVLMEAMACACPVVATAIAGVPELVRDRETGLVVSPGRADELARAIAELIEDPCLRAKLANAGRRHVAQKFDVRRSAIQLESFFARMLRDGGPSDEAPTAASELGARRRASEIDEVSPLPEISAVP